MLALSRPVPWMAMKTPSEADARGVAKSVSDVTAERDMGYDGLSSSEQEAMAPQSISAHLGNMYLNSVFILKEC